MIVHRLRRPVNLPGLTLAAITLRRPVQADRDAIVAEIARSGAVARTAQAAILIAQLSDLPVEAVRRLSAADAHAIVHRGTALFAAEGLI